MREKSSDAITIIIYLDDIKVREHIEMTERLLACDFPATEIFEGLRVHKRQNS